jgi:hypothetical protein
LLNYEPAKAVAARAGGSRDIALHDARPASHIGIPFGFARRQGEASIRAISRSGKLRFHVLRAPQVQVINGDFKVVAAKELLCHTKG